MFGEGSERKIQERAMREAGRLPPGQSLTLKWPVLHEGTVPQFDPKTWDFRVTGLVNKPLRLSWDEFTRLPMKQVTADMHCVTRWSRFDVRWEGVPFAEVMKLIDAKPEAKYVMVLAEQGYTSNVPLENLMHADHAFRVEAQWRAAAAGTRVSGAAGGAGAVCVEEREMGARIGIHGEG